jgi:anti-sigma factor RsiW
MGCPIGDADELILAHCAGRLEPRKVAEFERHLMACAKCRELAEAQRKVWSLLDSWPPTVPSADFDERLFQRIALEQQRSWWRRWVPAWSAQSMVPAIVACCALIAAFLIKTPALRPEPQSPTETGVKIEQVEHQLDDIDLLKQLGLESPTSDRGSGKI